jgi:hypothetical protein
VKLLMGGMRLVALDHRLRRLVRSGSTSLRGQTSARSRMPSCAGWSGSSMTALESDSVTGHRHRCSWENTQEPWTQQVLHLLLESRKRANVA